MNQRRDKSGSIGSDSWKNLTFGGEQSANLIQEAVAVLWNEHSEIKETNCREHVGRLLSKRKLAWVQPDNDYDEQMILISKSRLVAFVKSVSQERERLLSQAASLDLEGLIPMPAEWEFVIDYTSHHQRGDRKLDI